MSDLILTQNFMINGVGFAVMVERDLGTYPRDSECYSPKDFRDFENGHWGYVGITVEVAAWPGTGASLWGCDWGLLAGRHIGLDQHMDTVKDLAGQAMDQLTERLSDGVKLLRRYAEHD